MGSLALAKRDEVHLSCQFSIMGSPALAKREEVQLLGSYISPIAHRVEWDLKLKGIEYEFLEEDLFNKCELLLKSNPMHKLVPVLLHKGNAIPESFVILEYLDETWKKNPLLPEDPYERAQARFWVKYFDEKFTNTAFIAFICKGEQQEKAVESLRESLAVIEGELKGKKFFAGETIRFLDLVVGWIPWWLPVLEEVRDVNVMIPQDFPHFHAWCQRLVEVPLIKENLPSHEELTPPAKRKWLLYCF